MVVLRKRMRTNHGNQGRIKLPVGSEGSMEGSGQPCWGAELQWEMGVPRERGEKRGKGEEGRALLGRGFWQADEWPQRERSRETLKGYRGSPGKG